MASIKLILVLLMHGFLGNPIMGRELTAPRMKRSLTTICVEIKPSGPQEEPYYMCKGTDLPPLVPKDSGTSYKSNNPSYGGSNFQAPKPAYNAQYQDLKSESYEKQPANSNQNNGPGYGGFRRPASESAASYQPQTRSPVQQTDVAKQQFFPKPPEFQSQQKYEQQQKQFKSSPPTQPAAGYGFATGNPNHASYSPSNSQYVSESGATQAQSAYSESGGNPSGGGGTYVRPQSSAASYGSGTKQHNPNVASGSFAKSSFSTSFPAASAAQAPFGQTLPYANAAVASADVEEHGYAEETPSSAFMVPATQKSPVANIKTKNSAVSQYGAEEQPKNDQNSYAANVENSRAAALYQSSPAKTVSPKLKDYRSMLSEDIFQSPIWGFSPDEFASFRSISDEVEQPFHTSNGARSQQADSFLRHMPPEYRDDPVMREFYKSLHEPLFAPDPLLTMPIGTRSAYNSKGAKLPTSTAARPLKSAPQPQRAPPQVKQQAVINSGGLCETTTPPPPPPRQQPQQCSPDSIAASPYASPTRLSPSPNCEPCNRRDYNFQPVFIALPCYGQQTGFGNLNPGAAAYLNLGVSSPQSSYPSPMNQYAASLPGEAALYSGFGPGANLYPARQSASPAFGMPYAASNLGSSNPFGFYNNPQYSAANRASSAEENTGRQASNISKPAVRKPASSNERGLNSASQESVELDTSKSTETTNNEFTMNTSMETAETKATQPPETTTSVTEATGGEIQKMPATNARTSGNSKEQLVGVDANAKDAENAAVNNQEHTTKALPMEEETLRTYESMMDLAQQFGKLNQNEFIDFDFDDDKVQVTPVKSNGEKRKDKRQNARQQGAVYKRQNVPVF